MVAKEIPGFIGVQPPAQLLDLLPAQPCSVASGAVILESFEAILARPAKQTRAGALSDLHDLFDRAAAAVETHGPQASTGRAIPALPAGLT